MSQHHYGEVLFHRPLNDPVELVYSTGCFVSLSYLYVRILFLVLTAPTGAGLHFPCTISCTITNSFYFPRLFATALKKHSTSSLFTLFIISFYLWRSMWPILTSRSMWVWKWLQVNLPEALELPGTCRQSQWAAPWLFHRCPESPLQSACSLPAPRWTSPWRERDNSSAPQPDGPAHRRLPRGRCTWSTGCRQRGWRDGRKSSWRPPPAPRHRAPGVSSTGWWPPGSAGGACRTRRACVQAAGPLQGACWGPPEYSGWWCPFQWRLGVRWWPWTFTTTSMSMRKSVSRFIIFQSYLCVL